MKHLKRLIKYAIFVVLIIFAIICVTISAEMFLHKLVSMVRWRQYYVDVHPFVQKIKSPPGGGL